MNTLTAAQRERVLGLLREGKTLRQIERETGHRRETIAAYARRAGLLGDVARLDDLREPVSVCEPHRERILAELERGTSLRAVHDELVVRFAFTGSYSTLKRYVRTQLAPATALMLAA